MESMETKLLAGFFSRAKPFFRLFVCICLLAGVSCNLFSQVLATQRTIKFPVWVLIEPEPSCVEDLDESKNGALTFAITHMRTSVPFILEGLIYGWNFTYTPSDKMRNVEEYFEYTPISEIKLGDKNISFSQLKADESRFSCWVAYERTDLQYALRQHWNSVKFPKIAGTGSGSIRDGDNGIHDAYAEAILKAVREYVQGFTKNKPKEISGSVLLENYPLLSIQSGRYVAKLELLVNISRIVPYSTF
ncbi:MAG: hypothetical protein J5798_09485 [Spirochaetaceae bacterium]|nr:hypothetical protein [Spirochaetaceae bacterium]